jgi:hypothetical protein
VNSTACAGRRNLEILLLEREVAAVLLALMGGVRCRYRPNNSSFDQLSVVNPGSPARGRYIASEKRAPMISF